MSRPHPRIQTSSGHDQEGEREQILLTPECFSSSCRPRTLFQRGQLCADIAATPASLAWDAGPAYADDACSHVSSGHDTLEVHFADVVVVFGAAYRAGPCTASSTELYPARAAAPLYIAYASPTTANFSSNTALQLHIPRSSPCPEHARHSPLTLPLPTPTLPPVHTRLLPEHDSDHRPKRTTRPVP